MSGETRIERPWGEPYWYVKDELPGIDFNRQIIEPQTEDCAPDGAVAIYVDDDFWCVALLPWKEFGTKSIQEIVAALWPSYADDAEYAPDHGTIDQRLYQLEQYADSCERREKAVWKEYTKLQDEVERYRRGRTGVAPRARNKREMHTSYFVRQYEHLLTAFAHAAVPRTDKSKGICSICGLVNTDRVHMKQWIEKRREGFAFILDWAGSYPDEPASADTRPEGGDSTKIEAPFTGGAVPRADEADAQ